VDKMSLFHRSVSVLRPAVRLYSASTNETVGFIGLGNMGRGMAENLISKGHSVMAYDVSAEAVSAIVAKGGIEAQSPGQVAAGASRVVTMLPNNAIVEKVYTEIFLSVKAGTFLVDSSTVDPALSKQLALKAQ